MGFEEDRRAFCEYLTTYRRPKLNYEEIVDVFIPHVPRVPTDAPLNPQEFMDKFELQQEYKKAYMEACMDKTHEAKEEEK